MSLRMHIDPLAEDFELILSETMSPSARSRAVAGFAKEQIEDVKQTNRAILGRVPHYTVAVDGRMGAALESVKPDGVIITEFDVDFDKEVLTWLHDQLRIHSPISDGRDPDPNVEYLDSHKLFADGNETDIAGEIPAAREFVFVNTVPYAAKIERGESTQAPDGVYQVVAVLGQGKFPAADIRFEYRSFAQFPHMPAIVVRSKRS